MYACEGIVQEWREKGKLQNCREATAQVDDEVSITLVCNPTFCWHLRLLRRSLFILLPFLLHSLTCSFASFPYLPLLLLYLASFKPSRDEQEYELYK